MPKIAISSEGPTLEDQVDPRFGRAAGFVIADPKNLSITYINNGTSQALSQGAGIQAAETVAKAGVTAVLTGYVGPKAFQALNAAGIKVAQDFENLSVREAIERYNNGEIKWAELSSAMGPR
ncbi:MAG: NifB/NifX family molybdenum-iron cluster-binding protein [Desulfobacteraceae bacterium]|jgi:predicted Fe-Mo cluster-binding NifX family protein